MTQTFSASMFWSDSLHVVRKPVPLKKMAATIDPTIMHSTHRLVATAPIMIKSVIKIATNPRFRFMYQTPFLLYIKKKGAYPFSGICAFAFLLFILSYRSNAFFVSASASSMRLMTSLMS